MSTIKKILIISDTHGNTKNMDEVIKKEKADFCIHCGDFDNWGMGVNDDEIIDEKYIKSKFQHYIYGNHGVSVRCKTMEECMKMYNDNYEIFNIGKFKCLLTHNIEWMDESHREQYKKFLDKFNDIQVKMYKLAIKNKVSYVFCGHTHVPKIYKINGMTIVNPGTLGKIKGNGKLTYAIGLLNDNGIEFTIKDFTSSI